MNDKKKYPFQMADFFIFAKLYFIGISSFTTIEKSTLAQLCCLLPSGSKVLSSPNFPKKKNQRKSLLPVKALPACLTRIHMSKHSRKYSITFQSLYEHFDIKNCKGNNAQMADWAECSILMTHKFFFEISRLVIKIVWIF